MSSRAADRCNVSDRDELGRRSAAPALLDTFFTPTAPGARPALSTSGGTMILNRDAGAVRSPSHTGPRPTRRPTNPNVGGVVVADEPRATPAMAAVNARRNENVAATEPTRRTSTIGAIRLPPGDARVASAALGGPR